MNKLIVITTPYFFEEEGILLTALFEEGLEYLHLRKPNAGAKETGKLLDTIPNSFHSRIRLHDCFELADYYAIGGLHLNKRNSHIPGGFRGTVSRSCHTLQEVRENNRLDYVFLSPVFPSISKEGYGSNFPMDVLQKASAEGLINNKVIALGGIDTTTIPLLKGLNFGGVAILGALWGETSGKKELVSIIQRYKLLRL